jgi:cobalamin biosynthesis protein CobT
MTGIDRVIRMACDITEKPIDDKTRLQALSLLNECHKYKMDLTTNGVVITDAIKFVQANKEKLTTATMSIKEKDNGKESEEPDYNEDKDQLEEEQEKKTGETEEETTINQVF